MSKTRPRVPFCWLCGRKLRIDHHGHHYALAKDEAGVEHPAHKQCVRYRQTDDNQEALRDWDARSENPIPWAGELK